MIVKLGDILNEEKTTVGSPDGNGLNLIGVSNEIGLHTSRAKKINNLSRYKINKLNWFAYNPMRINVGSIGYAKNESHIGLISPDYVVFSCSDNILPEYLFWLLKSEEGQELISKNASGAVRKRLYFKDLGQIEIELPSIDIQKQRINFYLKVNRLQNKIEQQLSKDSYITQLKQAILQEAMEGKLTADWRRQNPEVESADQLLERIKVEKQKLIAEKIIKKAKPLPSIKPSEIPFETPKEWAWCRIQDISILKSGNSYKYFKGTEEDIPYVKVGDMNIPGNSNDVLISSNYYLYEDSMEKNLIIPKSIIFPKRGGAIATNKRCNVLSKKILIDSNSMAIKPSELINFNFFSWWFKTIDLSSFGNESVIPQVNNKDILPITFPLPPLKEQKAIVVKLEKLMQRCEALEEEIKDSYSNSKKLMQAVLKEAFETKK